MSVDIIVVDGYGINATELSWKTNEEVQSIIEKEECSDLRDYIERFSTLHLEYAEVADNRYVYVQSVYPLDSSAGSLLTKEQIGQEIHRMITPFLSEALDVEAIMHLLGGVFDWETC